MKSLKNSVNESFNVNERYQKRGKSEPLKKSSDEYKRQDQFLSYLEIIDGVENAEIFSKKNWGMGVLFDFEQETYYAQLDNIEGDVDLYYYTANNYSQHWVKEKPFNLERPYTWAIDQEGE